MYMPEYVTGPGYSAIAVALQDQIAGLAPNSAFPTEVQLARRFNVSRGTIRRALRVLEQGGLLTRRPGRGTIVNPPKIVRHLSPILSLDADLQKQGIKLETRVLAYEPSAAPPPVVRERLALAAGVSVGFLSLLRLVDDRIICHDRRYFPPAVASRFDPGLMGRSMPEVIGEIAGTPVTTVDWESDIVPAPPDVAATLGLTPGVIVVANTLTDLLADGTPASVAVMYYRFDRVKFKFASPRTSR